MFVSPSISPAATNPKCGNDVHPQRVVVIVVSDLEFGGAQRQVIELVNHLNEDEWCVYVCSLASYVPLAESLNKRKQRFRLILRQSRFDFTVVLRLARFLREVQADVVHSYLFDAAIAARLAGKLAGRAAVIDTERNTGYTLKKIEAIAFRLTRWCNDLTIANSRAGAAFNSKVLGHAPENYRVIHNGVDVNRFKPQEESQLRQKLKIAVDQPIVGMFASFKPQKNHSLLLRAAREIVQRVPNVRFLFVGDELYKGMSESVEVKRTINELIDSFNLRRHCLFAGNQAQVERYYNLCTLTALPSLFEGTPNAALESMACGVPVVATDVSDNAYVIPDGKAGFIVPSGDEQMLANRICRLLTNEAELARMSQTARQWALDEFSCQRLAEKTAAVYHEAINLKLTGRTLRRESVPFASTEAPR